MTLAARIPDGATVFIDRGSRRTLTTGTLITVTDDRDTAGAVLLPIDPRFNLISVGVSGDIDDVELTRFGPQGSFLAPEPADRDAAFATIAQRIAEYPRRAHCSSSDNGCGGFLACSACPPDGGAGESDWKFPGE